MKKIIFYSLLLIFFFLPSVALAFSDDCERYLTDYTEKWTQSGSGSVSLVNYPTGYATANELKLYTPSSNSGQACYLASKDYIFQNYLSFKKNYWYFFSSSSSTSVWAWGESRIELINSAGSVVATYTMNRNDRYSATDTGNYFYEVIRTGNTIYLYRNGVLQGTMGTVSGSEIYKVRFSVWARFDTSGGGGSANSYMYIDDITSDSIIGMEKEWYETTNPIELSYLSQSYYSYQSSIYTIDTYCLSGTTTGLINSTQVTGATGYLIYNTSQVFGTNYGLYLIELNRDNTTLYSTYFVYSQLSNPLEYPEVLFIGGSNVNTDIKDEDNNGGEVLSGETVYLYPALNENGIYNITYDILETPFSIELSLQKIYNSTALNQTNITISGLSEQSYNISVDSVSIGGNAGYDTFEFFITDWSTSNKIITLEPDYTLPGIWGYVKNEETQNPLKSATVTISNNTSTEYIYTDSNGMYYKTYGMIEGSYSVSASKTNFKTSNVYNLTTTAGTTTRQDIFLAPESGSGVYYAPHSVTFTVLEYWYNYTGLPGVNYSVYDNSIEETIKTGYTDSKGQFTIKEMDQGTNYSINLSYNGLNVTEYIEPGLSEYTLILNKEGAIHTYVNNWLTLSYSQNSTNATVNYNSSKTITSASLLVIASNGTIAYSQNLATQNGTFYFTFSPGDYSIQFHILASDGSEASQAWTISNPVTVDLFPGSYPTWLKNTLFTAIVLLFLLAFGKSRNDVACGSVAVLTSFGYFFQWLTCSFNFVVLVWIVAFAGILLHYRRTGALG